MGRASAIVIATFAAFQLATAARAQAVEAPYEKSLLRLSEVLGSLHFLRNLCGEKGSEWRLQMEKLLETENPPPDRRGRLVASFNRGYRAFDASYASCTASAAAAISRYMQEGEALTREIATRYGN